MILQSQLQPQTQGECMDSDLFNFDYLMRSRKNSGETKRGIILIKLLDSGSYSLISFFKIWMIPCEWNAYPEHLFAMDFYTNLNKI